MDMLKDNQPQALKRSSTRPSSRNKRRCLTPSSDSRQAFSEPATPCHSPVYDEQPKPTCDGDGESSNSGVSRLESDVLKNICMGMICPDGSIRAPQLKPQNSDFVEPSSLLAGLDTRTSNIVKPLFDRSFVRVQAIQNAGKVYLNLYAMEDVVKRVGTYLSSNRIYLQHPIDPLPDFEYQNPHFLTRPGTLRLNTNNYREHEGVTVCQTVSMKMPGTTSHVTTVVLPKEAQKGDIERLLDSLGRSRNLEPMEQHVHIITPLLLHQKEAVSFMIQRERIHDFNVTTQKSACELWTCSSATDERLVYQNLITQAEQYTTPVECRGGLLADHMGLGKTLSMLSLIAHTLQEAEEAELAPLPNSQSPDIKPVSRATLVVTPLSTLQGWEQQIKEHVKPGQLNSWLYHGKGRSLDTAFLSKYNIVLTTYDTVSSEWAKLGKQPNRTSGALHNISWFRIVLDEAHLIRNRGSQKSKAINALCAERRWCVTGTPIQNSLDDIAALIQFLRIEPFDQYQTFNNNILVPLKRGNPQGIVKLRTLIDYFTLRRVKETVQLPSRDIIHKIVELRPTERQHYDTCLQKSKFFLDKALQDRETGAARNALEIILHLRLICDHGTDLLPLNGNESPNGDTVQTILREDIAVESQFAKSSTSAKDAWGFYDDFNVEDVQIPDIQVTGPDEEGDIPMPDCPASPNVYYHNITGSANLLEKYPNYNGPSSKVQALLHVLMHPDEKWISGPDPIKSVVFSSWTKMLDLVEIALVNHNIMYCRLDGSMSRKARDISLDKFRDESQITVMLVSLLAGGVGLNLTSASQVHLLEPHWNPMIEEQALERVHRIGQTKEVQVFRYIVKDSFENSMIELQARKQGMARLGMENLTKADLRVERLKEIRALFS